MCRLLLGALASSLISVSGAALADLNIFACEPEWGALAREIGGDKVSIFVATTALQDAHRIEARPGLIAKARAADMTVCTGAELEAGWLPAVQRQSANPKIRDGAPGVFEAAEFVTLRDVPTRLDRADGDVHAAGNPHIQTDPRSFAAAAQGLATRMILLDAANADHYEARYRVFSEKWKAAMDRWGTSAAPLRGMPIAVQHANWPYLVDWLGLEQVVTLEPKPGVPPSAGHLADVVARVRAKPVAVVIRAPYEDKRPSEYLSAQVKVPAVVLPYTIGGTPEARDLFSLFDDTIARLRAVKP